MLNPVLSTTEKLETLPSLRETIESSGLWAKSSLGQNFLLDLNITRKIVRVAGDLTGATVIEIGPGPGGLTRAILESSAKHVISIEKDSRALTALAPLQSLFLDRLEIYLKDALQTNVSIMGSSPRLIIANLPYNIATILLIQWLKQISQFSQLILMFQREVAERIIATPNTKNYGRLSVMTQWLCHVEHVMTLPPKVFFPSPKVHSSVIRLIPRKCPLFNVSWEGLESILRLTFSHRRKMLRSGLKSLGIVGENILKEAHIKSTLRPENLTLEDFGRLTKAYEKTKIS